MPFLRFRGGNGVRQLRWVAIVLDARTVGSVRHVYRRPRRYEHELDYRDILSAKIVHHARRLFRTPSIRPDRGHRIEVLLHLLAILEWRRYDWDAASAILGRPGVRRRIARLTGVRRGERRRGLVVLRGRDNGGRAVVHLGGAAANMTSAEKEVLGLLTIWAGEGFDPSRPAAIVESRFVPFADEAKRALGWVALGDEWSEDRIEILERLLADGMPAGEAAAVALRV